MSSATTANVNDVIADALGLEPGEVGAGASMDTLEVWDSLQHLGVITAIEAAFDCRLGADEIPRLTSVERIVARLEGLKRS